MNSNNITDIQYLFNQTTNATIEFNDFLIYFNTFSFKTQLILLVYLIVFIIIFYELYRIDKKLDEKIFIKTYPKK